MDISEKAAYVKGLFDGLELDPADKTTKVLKALVDLVSEMAEEVSALEQSYDDVSDQIDALDEDLSGLEDLVSDLSDACADEFDADRFGDCDSCGKDCSSWDDSDEDDSDAMYETVCPTCGTEIPLNIDDLGEGGITCPSCGEELAFDFDPDELDDELDDDDDEASQE